MKDLIEKYKPLRKKKTIEGVIVYEMLVGDLLKFERGELGIIDLIKNNTNLTEDEIEYLPVSFYIQIRDNILNFDSDKEEKEGNIKKN